MKYKVTLNGRTYEVEVVADKAMCVAEYEAYAPAAAPAPVAAPVAAPAAAPAAAGNLADTVKKNIKIIIAVIAAVGLLVGIMNLVGYDVEMSASYGGQSASQDVALSDMREDTPDEAMVYVLSTWVMALAGFAAGGLGKGGNNNAHQHHKQNGNVFSHIA